MSLDDLALPFWIEQISKTFRRLLTLYQLGVVGNHAERGANGGVLPIGIAMLRRNMFGDILRHIGRQQILTLPCKKLRSVPCAHGVRHMQARREFLRDAGKNSFAARPLDTHAYTGKSLLESLSDFFRKLEIRRGVPGDLALFRRGGD